MSAGLLLGIGVTVAAALSPKGVEPVRNAVMRITVPLRQMAGTAASWIEARTASAQEVEALKEENQALREEVTRLTGALLQGEKDSEENSRLRELLGLQNKHQDFSYGEMTIAGRDQSDWKDLLTLSGDMEQVSPGDCVITSGGALAGVVREVGTGWCTAVTPLDPSFTLGVSMGRKESSAAARGTLAGLATGRVALDYLTQEERVKEGDLVLTAGDTGLYPPGLILGQVEEVTAGKDGLTLTGWLTPQASWEVGTSLYVVVEFQGEVEP